MAAVGAELRDSINDEYRLEAEAEERAVATYRLRHRRLRDVAVELMHRGEAVTACIGGSAVRGHVIHVASDLASLKLSSGRTLHLNLDSPITLSRRHGASGGRGAGRNRSGCDSFTALLRSLELARKRVRLEAVGQAAWLGGRIATVAIDHVVFATNESDWFVPLGAITGIWEETESRFENREST